MLKKSLIGLLIVVIAAAIWVPAVTAQDTATTSDTLNVRATPNGQILTTIPQGTSVILEARNADASWVLVRTADGAKRGWVSAGFLVHNANLMALPESSEAVAAGAAPAPQQPAPQQPAQPAPSGANGVISSQLNIRSGPGTAYDVIGSLAPNSVVILLGRNSLENWLYISTEDGATRGWVAANFVVLPAGVTITSLAVTDATGEQSSVNTINSEEYLANVPIPSAAQATIPAMISTLQRIPTHYNFTTGRVYQIYRTGQSLGNKPYVFTRVGDSLTSDQPFLKGFGPGGNYNLGPYGHLQVTVDFFSQPIWPGNGTHSFSHTSLTTLPAFNALAVHDKMWSNPAVCDPTSESPMECEYRITKPSVAIILLGPADIQVYTIQQYTAGMRKIITDSIEAGVIPVLTTFSIPPDYIYYEKALRFNVVLISLAQQYNIPLINLWKEAQRLPDTGVGPDRYHLSMGDESTWYNFAGAEGTFGVTLRNLLSLQALDLLRANVLR